MRRLSAALVVIFLFSCGPAPKDVAQSSAPPPAAETIDLPQRCTHPQYGFSVSYPAGWHTNNGEVLPSCTAFHHEPFDIPRESEMPFQVAIVFALQEERLEDLRFSSQWEEVLSAERLSIGGHEVWLVESRATGEGLAERGMRTYRYVIDLGRRGGLIASTHDAARDYATNRKVLDAMVQSLEFPR